VGVFFNPGNELNAEYKGESVIQRQGIISENISIIYMQVGPYYWLFPCHRPDVRDTEHDLSKITFHNSYTIEWESQY
jgi:hypothetical protein